MVQQTAFRSMEDILFPCAQLGRMIEKYMFTDPHMVLQLSTQYVQKIEQKIQEHEHSTATEIENTFFASEDHACFRMKMDWIKEKHAQTDTNNLTLSTVDLVRVYRFLLQITHWYVQTFEPGMATTPAANELRELVYEDAFRENDPLWQQLKKESHTSTPNHTSQQIQPEKTSGSISYQNKELYVPMEKTSIDLQELAIKGCDHFLKELTHKNMYTIQDLPSTLDSIHLQLTGVGPATVQKMWDQLVQLFSEEDQESTSTPKNTGEQVIQFADETIVICQEVAHIPIQRKDFPGSVKTIESMKASGIHTYGQLPEQFSTLKKIKGIGHVRIKHVFNQIKELIPQFKEEMSLRKLTNDERMQYEYERFTQWFHRIETSEAFAKKEKIPERYVRILRKRFHAKEQQQHVTLQQLGDEEGITRERIRQIIQRGNTHMRRKWHTYLACVQKKVKKEGYMNITEPVSSLQFADYILIQALEIENMYVYEKYNMSLLIPFDGSTLDAHIEACRQEFKQLFDVTPIQQEKYDAYCEEQAKKYQLPFALVEKFMNDMIHWMEDGQGTLKHLSKLKAVEQVMLQYPNGAAIYKDEVRLNQEADKLMPGKFTHARDFTAVFSREEVANLLFLWARGVYIHKTFITADPQWVKSVQQKAKAMLVEKEFIHVRKLYAHVKEEALEQHIPNEYALFSTMRLYDAQILSLERFPMIQLLGEERVDNTQRIIHYFEEKQRPVTKKELIHSFVDKRGWKTFTVEQILSDTDEILPYEHGVYTLASDYGSLQKEDLSTFFKTIEDKLQDQVVMSIHTLFAKEAATALALEIDTPHLLYALIKKHDTTRATYERFPYIVASDADADTITNQALVEEYIAEQQTIVCRKDIEEWLQTITNGATAVLDFALLHSDSILYYERGQAGKYMHRDTIDMHPEKEQMIFQHIDQLAGALKEQTGKEYMSLKDVYQQVELPPLANGIEWNEVLLGDLMKKSDRWHMYGSYDEIYMPKELPYADDIDLIELIIQSEFSGSVSAAILQRYLEKIRYSNTGEFLGTVQTALENNEAPFVRKDGWIIHKDNIQIM